MGVGNWMSRNLAGSSRHRPGIWGSVKEADAEVLETSIGQRYRLFGELLQSPYDDREEATGGNQRTCDRELNAKFRIVSGSGYTDTKRMTLLK
jgi:hypothetical protein